MATDERKLQIKQAVEKIRFGYTREQILKEKGAYCHQPLKPGDHHEGLLVISHINGGGRHATENGMIIPGKTHNMDNFTVLCQRHDGMKDRIRDSHGLGIEGHNNPSQ